MPRNKLKRFAENATSHNVIEPGKEEYAHMKGKWHEVIFKNDNPITLELGCGNGEYTVGLANKFPQRNLIGVDIKGSRIWRGRMSADEHNLTNVGFLRTSILDLENFFQKDEVGEIWITFPDPRPRLGDAKRRLTSERFQAIYKRILSEKGFLHLKTDDKPLYDFTLEVLDKLNANIVESTSDLYDSNFLDSHYGIQTTYERRFLAENKKICYIKYQFNYE